MRMLPLCLLTIGVAVSPSPAAGDPIQIFLDGRNVSASALIRNNSDQILENGQQLFGAPTASAAVVSPEGYLASAFTTLSSSVSDPGHLFGAGTGATSATVPPINEIGLSQAASFSTFGVSFLVDRSHAFDFSGVFTGSDSLAESGNSSRRAWTASLVRHSTAPDFTIFDHRRVLTSGTEQVRETGLIPFGEYTLFVQGLLVDELQQPGSTHASHEEFAFTFDLIATPEPASVVLLGSGLMGVLVIRRRRSVSA
jgi:hypothetical protein